MFAIIYVIPRHRERGKARRLNIRRKSSLILDKQLQILRTALFWVITQPVAVISYRRFETTYRSHLQSQESTTFLPSKMGPIGYPETSVRNYHYLLYNGPEESSSHLLRGGSLKSRTVPYPVCGCFVVQKQFCRIRCVHYTVTDKRKSNGITCSHVSRGQDLKS